MTYKSILIFGLIGFNQFIYSQTITGKILDKSTKEPIPNAHISLSSQIGVVSNQEGFFSLSFDKKFEDAIILVSALGYELVKISAKNFSANTEIFMQSTDLVLDEVVVGSYNNPVEIINQYIANSKQNHFFMNQKMIGFKRYKESYLANTLEIELLDVSFKDKKTLEDQIQDFTNKFRNKKAISHKETLFEIYFSGKDSKVNPIKALKINDETGLDIDNFQDHFFKNILKSLKSPYTYKIQSGWIPLEKDVSLNELTDSESSLDTLFPKDIQMFSFYGSITFKEFINKPNLYDYTLKGIKNIRGFKCYHISFKPGKNKGKFKGNLYINMSDFALVRYQYELDSDKKEFGLNLKWLLGIKINTFKSSETAQFVNTESGFYYPIFTKTTMSNYAYVNRGLSMKENNPNRAKRKILKLDFKIEMIAETVEEVLIIEMETLRNSEIDTIETKDYILFDSKLKYNPDYWKAYHILESIKEIKKFENLNE
jgi:hypothetical protein